MRKIISLLVGVVLLVACDLQPVGLPEDFDRSGQAMQITVVFHENINALHAAYRAHEPGGDTTALRGFSFWKQNAEPPYACEIHAVKPTRDGDDKMMTLGHELTHCLIGSFHASK